MVLILKRTLLIWHESQRERTPLPNQIPPLAFVARIFVFSVFRDTNQTPKKMKTPNNSASEYGEVIVEDGKCEWLVTTNLPGHCLSGASYVDATGKHLCTEHAEHLNRRFGVELTLISPENAKGDTPI